MKTSLVEGLDISDFHLGNIQKEIEKENFDNFHKGTASVFRGNIYYGLQ